MRDCDKLAQQVPQPALIRWLIWMRQVDKADFMVWLACCLVALFVGVDWGLACGVGIALFILLYRTAFPQVSVLEEDAAGRAFRCACPAVI